MPPLAYHITWTAYGTWLPGDERGWVESGTAGIQPPDNARQETAKLLRIGSAVEFDESQRTIIRRTIEDHCRTRNWTLPAINVRSNHVHVLVSADRSPEEVMKQLKAWCSRKLSDAAGLAGSGKNGRRKWFTEHGSTKWINDNAYLLIAIRYVEEGQ